MKPGVNLWSCVLIHNHPTRGRESVAVTAAIDLFNGKLYSCRVIIFFNHVNHTINYFNRALMH